MPKINSKNKVVLGITGGIASGKTTVMQFLAKSGIATVSSDDLAHACIRQGKPAYHAILNKFGRDILGKDAQIDRRKLGRIVFADPAKRKQLEKIVHPCVAYALKNFIKAHHGVIALDIPLLYEAKYESWMDKVIVVSCTQAQQIKRLMSRNGLSRHDALLRIAAQMPLSSKRRRADIVIDNRTSIKNLEKQIARLLRLLLI